MGRLTFVNFSIFKLRAGGPQLHLYHGVQLLRRQGGSQCSPGFQHLLCKMLLGLEDASLGELGPQSDLVLPRIKAR